MHDSVTLVHNDVTLTQRGQQDRKMLKGITLMHISVTLIYSSITWMCHIDAQCCHLMICHLMICHLMICHFMICHFMMCHFTFYVCTFGHFTL